MGSIRLSKKLGLIFFGVVAFGTGAACTPQNFKITTNEGKRDASSAFVWSSDLQYAEITSYRGVAIDSVLPKVNGQMPSNFEIQGELPKGITFDAKTGAISGMALELKDDVTLLIKATGSRYDVSGSTTAQVKFHFNDFLLKYNTNVKWMRGMAITANTPQNLAGMTVTYSLAAGTSLPTGITLNPSTGEISGKPTEFVMPAPVNVAPTVVSAASVTKTVFPTAVSAAAQPIQFVVNVQRTDLAKSMTFPIAVSYVDLPPTGLVYSSPVDYTIGQMIAANTPTLDLVKGGPGVAWAISKGALPAGLVLDPNTGVISGTPTALAITPVSVTVTASNSGGSTDAVVTMRVLEVAPMGLVYTSPVTYIKSIKILDNLPNFTIKGGTPTQYVVKNLVGDQIALPSGLMINPTTGVISGTPDATSPRADYVIVASNSGGASSFTLSIEVGSLIAKTETQVVDTQTVKNVDIVFVVDNSGSMGNKQAELKDGFAAFAKIFMHRIDLDLCIKIITSSRYLSRGTPTYAEERSVPCTQSSGDPNMSQAQRDAYIDTLIEDFKNKINVGTSGSAAEHLGKSLAAYLYNQNSFSETMDRSKINPELRPDTLTEFILTSDEDNYGKTNAGVSKTPADLAKTDIPYKYGTLFNGAPDNRLGIYDYLVDAFSKRDGVALPVANAPGSVIATKPLNFALTAFLTTKDLSNYAENIGKTVSYLKGLGYIASESDILDYANYPKAIADALGSVYSLVTGMKLTEQPYEPKLADGMLTYLTVTLKSLDGTTRALVYGTDFLLSGNVVTFTDALKASFKSGDVATVKYVYYKVP